jgi:LysM repeat protein
MKHLYILALTLLSLAGFGQSPQLSLQQEGGKLFLSHKVAPKENWYSIGRMYNIAPNQAAAFNGTSISRGLVIGETLKIPMTAANFTQEGGAAADEVMVPVVHTVKEKEGLYRISQTYNKVSIDRLKAMNQLRSEEISVGSALVVGYLKVKKELSPLASAGKASVPVAKTETAPAKQEPVQKAEPAAQPKTDPAPVVKTAPPKTDPAPVVKTAPAEPATPAPKPVQTQTPVSTGGTQSASGGAFRGLFESQVGSAAPSMATAGMAASFKSTSGWKDGKYYVLMNKVTPGTVVRITNPQNDRSIYAKVLGEIPPMKENEGLAARISNAAAAELGLTEGKFDLKMAWTPQ